MSQSHGCKSANWALHCCLGLHGCEEASAHHCGKYCISTSLGPIGVNFGRVHLGSLEQSSNHCSLRHVQLGRVLSVIVLRCILNPYSAIPKVPSVEVDGQQLLLTEAALHLYECSVLQQVVLQHSPVFFTKQASSYLDGKVSSTAFCRLCCIDDVLTNQTVGDKAHGAFRAIAHPVSGGGWCESGKRIEMRYVLRVEKEPTEPKHHHADKNQRCTEQDSIDEFHEFVECISLQNSVDVHRFHGQ